MGAETDVDHLRVEASTFDRLDNTKFGWLHMKAILVAGIGFFCDAYDLFIINLVVPMISYAYYNHKIPKQDETILKGSAVIGTFFGQLIFGILGDKYGRKSVYGISLLLMVVGAIVSSMSSSAVRGMNVVAMLSIWRFVLGIGIGGDYPLSAVITSEYATVNTRGRMIAAVFAMQGIGQLTAGIVSLIVIASFKHKLQDDPLNADYVWRICLGVGCIPAIVGAYFRAKLPETPRFTAQVKGDVSQAQKDIEMVMQRDSSSDKLARSDAVIEQVEDQTATWSDFVAHYKQWQNLRVLIGCASSWFLLDVAFYGLGLNQSIVLTAIGFTASKDDTYKYLLTVAGGTCIINLLGSIPGYYVTVGLVERLGRVTVQMIGFVALTILFVILSAAYHPLKNNHVWLFIILYCMAQFFFNFGPNSTTFIIPGEVFPTRYRATSHGICAASGKLGAIISSYGFVYLVDSWGVQGVLGIFAVIMGLGIFSTLIVPETTGLSLEEVTEGKAKTLLDRLRR